MTSIKIAVHESAVAIRTTGERRAPMDPDELATFRRLESVKHLARSAELSHYNPDVYSARGGDQRQSPVPFEGTTDE